MNRLTIASEETLESKSTLEGITGLDNITKDFYYDETNNYRKFHFTSGNLNVENAGEFILGGIIVDRNRQIDLSALKSEIKLDKSINELKFKHVARGTLGEILKSRKIQTILEFMKSEKISIHLQRVNSFYWGIIDIIESIDLPGELPLLHWEIKDTLYHSLVSNLDTTMSILHTYRYPDIKSESIPDFYEQLSFLVKQYSAGDPDMRDMLLYCLNLGKTQTEAVFIQNEARSVLVNNYSHFYRDRILTFPNSNHIMDMEPTVKKYLESCENTFKGATLSNYSFIESHDSDGIQLSDVIVGLMSKIIDFCNIRSARDLFSLRRHLNGVEGVILNSIEEINSRSQCECRAYVNNIVPLSHINSYENLIQNPR